MNVKVKEVETGDHYYFGCEAEGIPELYAKLVCATRNGDTGELLTTLEVRMHRWVLAEFNTHRLFSRNSASSRAIPVRKRLADVTASPARPVVWASEKKGMQGGEEIEDVPAAMGVWADARESAVRAAGKLRALGVHKSIINRLLEPFLYHTVVVTSDSWDNFFEQRSSPLAQPEIQVVARLMWECLYRAHLWSVAPGRDWHTPYVLRRDEDELKEQGLNTYEAAPALAKVSAARCARVSYMTHDGQRSIEKDIELYDKLVSSTPMHASPLEHVARAVPRDHMGRVPGNFGSFMQLRHFVEMGIDPF